MTAPNQPTSLEGSLGELWRRVQILEAVRQSGGGDYVFLAEVGPIEDEYSYDMGFFDIPAIVAANGNGPFRHLVVELQIATYSDPVPAEMDFQFEPSNTTGTAWISYINSASPAVPLGQQYASDDLGYVVPVVGRNLQPGGTGFGDPPINFAHVTMKFQYYNRDDRVKGCLWQAGAYCLIEEPDESVAGYTASSGASIGYSTNPITDIQFAGNAGAYQGSIASLYGIR